MYIWKKVNLDLIPYINMNSKWIMILHVESKIIRLLKKTDNLPALD